MCSYKLVKAKFEVWGLQTKVEQWTHAVSRRGNSKSIACRVSSTMGKLWKMAIQSMFKANDGKKSCNSVLGYF